MAAEWSYIVTFWDSEFSCCAIYFCWFVEKNFICLYFEKVEMSFLSNYTISSSLFFLKLYWTKTKVKKLTFQNGQQKNLYLHVSQCSNVTKMWLNIPIVWHERIYLLELGLPHRLTVCWNWGMLILYFFFIIIELLRMISKGVKGILSHYLM